ncbi:MAG TPA: aldo/keto reductase [Chloroflexia bacterium]|jgi:aryl-alcohol dehydrogenase-like predicted oxidoreductase
MTLPQRPLGKTGVNVPIIGYGTAPLGKIEGPEEPSKAKAAKLLNLAIDLGITYLDTSPDYGSQPKLGEVMKGRRDEVFLATKINKRRRKDVLDEIRQNLKELQTDHVDLIQVHAVNVMADLEAALAPDGAMSALEEARQQGMTRFIGITGHARPSVLAHALDRYDFDTVLVALGAVDRLVSGPEEALLPIARRKDVGVIAMKVYGHGELKKRELALRYSLGLPGVSTAILGMKEAAEIEENVRLAQSFKPLEEDELQALLDEAKKLVESDKPADDSPIFWIYDSKSMAWQENSIPATVAY